MDRYPAGVRRRRLSLILGPLVGALLLWASPAWASPSYIASSPEPDERLEDAPASVWIDFDEPLDQGSYIEVTDECGRRIDAGNTEVTANRMEVGIARTPSGHYIVFYVARGVGGITGQERGEFHFIVSNGPDCGPSKGAGHAGHSGQDHGDHSGSGGSGGHAGHSGASGGSGGHAGHAGTGGEAGHAGRAETGRSAHAGHGSKKGGGDGGHEGHAGPGGEAPAEDEVEGTTLAADDTGELTADGGAVLAGLGLATALGVLGGWYLRITVP